MEITAAHGADLLPLLYAGRGVWGADVPHHRIVYIHTQPAQTISAPPPYCLYIYTHTNPPTCHHHLTPPKIPQNRTWSLWEYEIPVEKLEGKKTLEVAVKATDTSYNVQPERIEPYWNLVCVRLDGGFWDAVFVEYVCGTRVDGFDRAAGRANHLHILKTTQRGVLANCWPRKTVVLQEQEGEATTEGKAVAE